jgi:hypothetical protein
MLAIAYVAERIYRYCARQRARLDAVPARIRRAMAHNTLRLLLDVVESLFAVAAFGFFHAIYQGHEPSRLVVLAVLGSCIGGPSRFALPARAARASLRLLPLGDRAARQLHSTLLQFAVLYAAGLMPLFLLLRLGATQATADAIALVVAAIFLLVGVSALWSVRADIAALIRGPGETGAARKILADLWPGFATAYFIIVYVAFALDILAGRHAEGKGVASLILLIALPIVDLALSRALRAAMAPGEEPAGAPAGTPAGYEPVLRKAIHIVVIVVGALLFADIWSINLMTMAERAWATDLGALLGIVVILLCVHALAVCAHRDRADAETGRRLPAQLTDDEAVSTVATRLGTILPVLRVTLQVTILVVTTLSILAAPDRHLPPAGASVIGGDRLWRANLGARHRLGRVPSPTMRSGWANTSRSANRRARSRRSRSGRCSCAITGARSTSCPTARSSGCAT